MAGEGRGGDHRSGSALVGLSSQLRRYGMTGRVHGMSRDLWARICRPSCNVWRVILQSAVDKLTAHTLRLVPMAIYFIPLWNYTDMAH